MCRLILVNTGSSLLNKIILPTILQLSSQSNQDGTGFLVVDEESTTLYKSKEAADELPDLGLDILEKVVSNRPVLGHVRAASKGIVVTEENAHPFQGERFTLAHNGRLYLKDERVEWSNTAADTGLASDSQVFLNALEATAKKKKNAPFMELITETMSGFKGKFALLIYDVLEDKYYVIRGSTAELFMAPVMEYPVEGGNGTVLGFVVNTSKNVLADSMQISMQVGQAVAGVRLGMGKIEELTKETVYEVTGATLTKIGELKENTITYAGYQSNVQSGITNYVAGKPEFNAALPIWAMSQKISKFAREHFLGINDIDALFYLFLGIGIADSTPSDLDIFCECVIPKISAGKKIRQRLAKILDKYSQIYVNVYSSVPGLSYPWMVSSGAAINDMIKFYEKAKNQKKAAG
jgi:predicted glutamine amidotransferase